MGDFLFTGNMLPRALDADELQLKWVFTVSGDLHGYDEMTKVAVLSALNNTLLTPVCVFTGSRGHLSRWLEAHGVRMIYHHPKWRARLVSALNLARSLGHDKRSSPLYGDDLKTVATYLRVDVPTLGFNDPYILYADVDCIFTGNIRVSDFGVPPPEYFTMGAESSGDLISLEDDGRRVQLGNAGVMLMNVNGLRRTYTAFVKWLFSEQNLAKGMHFGVYGPGDQGAYNQFYQGRFRVCRWPMFNWKPYWGYTPEAKLIHFHGPKLDDYLGFIENGTATPLFRGLLRSCESEDPPPGVPMSSLRGRGCRTYMNLFQHWRKEARK